MDVQTFNLIGELIETFFPIVVFIIIASTIRKSVKATTKPSSQKGGNSKPMSKPAPMSPEKLAAMNAYNSKEVSRIQQKTPARPAEPPAQTRKPKDAFEVRTTATGVHIDKTSGANLIRLRREMEDRSNDWLAQQLAYERSPIRNNGLDLGASHMSGCAANDLKNDHRYECEDKYVDDGII